MTVIRLYRHPFSARAPEAFRVDSLGEWLLQRYGATPRVGVQVFEGEPSAATDISHDADRLAHTTAPVVTVLESPGLTEGVILFLQYLSAALTVYSLLFAGNGDRARQQNRTAGSPNNQLGNRDNQVRLLQRVEDIYGTVRAIPSLMMPTYRKYVAHRQVEVGYYCIGRGYYDVTAIRDGDTLISGISAASAAVWGPFTSPNGAGTVQLQIGDPIAEPLVTAARSAQVDGITLKAFNQVQLAASAPYSFAGSTITQDAPVVEPNVSAVVDPADQVLVTMTPQTVFNTAPINGVVTGGTNTVVDSAGGGVFFTDVVVGMTVTLAGFTAVQNNVTRTVLTKPNPNTITLDGAAMVNETVAGPTISFGQDFSGTYSVTAVADGVLTLAHTFPRALPAVTCTVAVVGANEWTDWTTLDDLDRTTVWLNVVALNGMFKDSGTARTAATVDFVFEVEQLTTALVPTGVVETQTGQLAGATQDERAITLERTTAFTGPCRVRMRRTTPYDYAFSGQVIDEVKWLDLYGVAPVSKTEFGNKTTIHTRTLATERATAARNRQLNCIASRLLPTYNGATFSGAFDATGRLASGTISATSKVVDIIAAVSVDPKIGARDLSTEVDMAQLWAVQQALDAWSPDVGQFNYTFDEDGTSFEETVQTIAAAAFCTAYRQNGKIRVAFDRAQPDSSALFTHRNKRPKAETITRKFASDAEYDGIDFTYADPQSDQPETITLPLDGSATKRKKVELPGIRNYTQAWYRANREYAKLLGQRLAIETDCTLDARLLLPGQRIDVVDNTRFKAYDGEVVAQAGLTLTLSQPVAFTPSADHSIVLMRRDGTLQSIACTAGAQPNQVVLQSLPTEAIVTTAGADGIRTIYSFAADSARGAMAWQVTEIVSSEPGYLAVRAINYADSYYAADTLPVPARESVIN